jgi:O-antigen ligase
VATGRAPIALVLAAVPILVLGLGVLVAERHVLALAAFGIGLVGQPLTDRLPLPVGPGIWPADLVIAACVVAWVLASRDRRPRLPRTPVLGPALLLFTVTVVLGTIEGNERWGNSLLGMPLRLVTGAALIFALAGLAPRRALEGLTLVFYGGAAFQTLLAAYHIGMGTSATQYQDLSTGGIRYLGVSAATFLAGSLLLAVVNLALRRGRQWVHALFLGLAAFAVLVSYTRTVYAALLPALAVLLVVYPRLRTLSAKALPLALPAIGLLLIYLPRLASEQVTSLIDRLASSPTADSSVEWREQAYAAVLSWANEEPLTGIGFGRRTTFWLDGMPNLIEGDPHNGFIYVYAGGGLLALGALLVLFGVYLADVRRRWRRAEADGRALLLWATATWFVFVLQAAAEPVFTDPSMLLALWGLMLLPALVPLNREARASG